MNLAPDDALDEITGRLPWSSGLFSDEMLPNEIEAADRIAKYAALGTDPETIRLMIRLEVACLYRITSRATWQAHMHALAAWTAHVEQAFPLAKRARLAAVEAARKAATGAYMRRDPRNAPALARQADDYGLDEATIETVIAEEAGWWLRRRAVND